MNVVVFEDRAVESLAPLTTARPACDLTIGIGTLADALARFGTVHRSLRPHLARHAAALAGRRVALWGFPAPAPPPTPPASSRGAILLVVNARTLPTRENIVTLRSLVEAGRRCIVRRDDTVAAALLHLAADGGGPDRAAVDAVMADPAAAVDILDALTLPHADAALELLDAPHEIVGAHERAIAAALAMQIDSGHFREVRPGLYAAPDAAIATQVEVRGGPVVVASRAAVGPFVCIDGPVWIGVAARVNPHAWIREATSIGAACRVGGEVEAAVLEPFSNKPHDGFLGHSHVGSWVNMAAGTTTGNLKATYGLVRLHTPLPDGGRATVHTGRQFLGALVGDLVKTAIHSALPCGARIGTAATVGGAVPEVVPAFANLVVPGGERTTAEQAATVLERMMARRGLAIEEADRDLLRALA